MQQTTLEQLLVIDIETVPQKKQFNELSETMQELWTRKHSLLRIEQETPEESFEKRAGIYAEFGKIICISVGYFHKQEGKYFFRLKSFFGDNENELLQEFSALLNKKKNLAFAGHNIKEFDIPYLCRRMVINKMALPEVLNFSGKKPWEVKSIDTLHLWRFGDYKNYTSLKLLAEILGIPSPKEDIEGKDVAGVYWQQNDLRRIMEYCQRDVVTVARLLLRFRNEAFELQDNDLVFVTE
ncbi:MAG: 3'-5' exonuclease [Chitinophagales bacterium]|nr:3'-5' exonuclease [Chitinophagales bacterium]MCO5270782.1 3'-5' exonuclease [Cyclobacteriaceae bacterium]OJV27060.1 MAG: 3'-5' exonuclease [Bacteroidetes bacterium 37-13]MCO5281767.1 3'-5' exonuclease [Chitinophagales bacterium]HRN95015.1 3'-5' exonuclease [Chitinophagales bacterium]